MNGNRCPSASLLRYVLPPCPIVDWLTHPRRRSPFAEVYACEPAHSEPAGNQRPRCYLRKSYVICRASRTSRARRMADTAYLEDACSMCWEGGIINAKNCPTFIRNCCAVQSSDFALVDYATIQHDAAWHFARHRHPWHEVIAVDKGGMSAQLPSLLCHARAGDVLFYPAACDHVEWTDSSSPARTLCLSLQGPATLSEALKPLTHDLHGRVLQLLRWIEQESKSGLFSHPECARRSSSAPDAGIRVRHGPLPNWVQPWLVGSYPTASSAGTQPDGYMDKWPVAWGVDPRPLTHIPTGSTATTAADIR